MTAERSSIRGVVETIFYSGPTFSAGRLRRSDERDEQQEPCPDQRFRGGAPSSGTTHAHQGKPIPPP